MRMQAKIHQRVSLAKIERSSSTQLNLVKKFLMATQNSDSLTRSSKRGLGRGLAALIPESDFDLLSGMARGNVEPAPLIPPDAKNDNKQKKGKDTEKRANSADSTSEKVADNKPLYGEVRYLKLSQIEANPFQPRQVWNESELEDLANSLREHGVLQPILVRSLEPLGEQTGPCEKFQIIAGERRWRAATRAGLKQIPAIVREVDDKSALELAIIENVQRHDISAVESAQAYRRLSSEFNLSQEKIAARVGKSRAAIANTMRLLDLPEEALQAVRNNEISEGHGRALLTASSDGARRALLRRTLRDHLSVREVERLAREGETASEPRVRLPRANAADIARLEDNLQKTLGMRLKLRARKSGGQLIIEYSSTEELQRLATQLTNSQK